MTKTVYIARLRVDGVIRQTEEYDSWDDAVYAAYYLWDGWTDNDSAIVELTAATVATDDLEEDPRQPGHKWNLMQYISDVGFTGLCLCAWVQVCDSLYKNCQWVWVC